LELISRENGAYGIPETAVTALDAPKLVCYPVNAFRCVTDGFKLIAYDLVW
jgi:hypothetical protein